MMEGSYALTWMLANSGLRAHPQIADFWAASSAVERRQPKVYTDGEMDSKASVAKVLKTPF